ncbi:Phytanoyl-CoA dioxygenase domain-containing protein 1-like protein, partial [Smittium mucronatum]
MATDTLSPQVISETVDFNGGAVVPDFLSADEVSKLRQEAATFLSDLDVSTHPMTVFSTGTEGKEHVGDQYFFDSWNNVSYFFEEGAVGPDGTLKVSKEKSINKIGHGLHVVNDAFRQVSLSKKVQQLASALGMKDPRVLQ